MVEINRVAKVVKGGRRFSFTALVVIGDEVDRVGVGYGKAREVPLAISKAVDDAKKNLFPVPKHGADDHPRGAGPLRRRARAAAPGQRGNRRHRRRRRPRRARARRRSATSSRRASARPNPINMLKATVNGLQSLRRPEEVARIARQDDRGRALPGQEEGRGAGPPESRARGRDETETVAKLKITQMRSQIGQTERHRGTLRALGLGKIGRSVERERVPEVAGMLRKVRHLVRVEEA